MIIPKNRLNGIIIGEYCKSFKASNSIKKKEGISPSLTSSINLSPVLAKSMNSKTTNTAINVLVQFLYKYVLIKFNVVIT